MSGVPNTPNMPKEKCGVPAGPPYEYVSCFLPKGHKGLHTAKLDLTWGKK